MEPAMTLNCDQSSEEPIFVADATVYIDAPTHEQAQGQMEDWVAEHMPENFVIGWTLTEDTEEDTDG